MNFPAFRNHINAPGIGRLLLQKGKVLPLLFLLTFFASLPALAQQNITVRGRVLNERSQPVAGDSVVVQGTSLGYCHHQ